jgi:hypothetical protein
LSKRKADNINIIITISKCTLGIKEWFKICQCETI